MLLYYLNIWIYINSTCLVFKDLTASDTVLSSSEIPNIFRTKSSVFGVEVAGTESVVVTMLSAAIVVSDFTSDVSVASSSFSTVAFSDSTN